MTPYRPMTLVDLAGHLTRAEPQSDQFQRDPKWVLFFEFVEEYSWEPVETRGDLLADEPPTIGDEHWDVLLAALAEHLSLRDDRVPPGWAEGRSLRRFWFPFNTPARRAEGIAHAPVAFRRRGVLMAERELSRA